MDGRFFEVDAALNALREREKTLPVALVQEFAKRLEISLIYHDSALEGVVLSYSEIKAAIDKRVISDVSLIPSYEEIKNFQTAMEFCNEYGANKKKPINVETVKKLYSLLTPDEGPKGSPMRKDNPLHRLYYHEISPPDKIVQRMKKYAEWFEEDATKRMHSVERAGRAHYRLMSIYPWTKNTGRVARLLSNLMMARDGYPPAVIHTIDRQRYYEVLRAEHAGMVSVYLESVATTIESANKLYDETAHLSARRKGAAA